MCDKLFQNVFIPLLYPTANPFIKQRWTVDVIIVWLSHQGITLWATPCCDPAAETTT